MGSKFRLLIHPKTQNPNRVLSDFQLIRQILLLVSFNLYLFPSSKLNVYVVVHFFLFAAFFSPQYGCKRFRILFDGEVHGFFFLFFFQIMLLDIFVLLGRENVVGYKKVNCVLKMEPFLRWCSLWSSEALVCSIDVRQRV